jgi:DNA invertase Pin-like site-specific DNA recombinase
MPRQRLERGVGLRVLAGHGAAVDATRADGRLIFAVLAALAGLERGVISERTRAGLKAARARAGKAARPRKMTASRIRMALAAMADPEARPKAIARELGVTTTTLYTYVNGDGTPKAAAEAILQRSARP